MNSEKAYQLALMATLDKQVAEELQAALTYQELDKQYGT